MTERSSLPLVRPLVLLCNDDGYAARGVRAMQSALVDQFDVVLCAPATNQSATSHALTLHRPLRLASHEPNVFSVDGTPADCVYVALGSGERVLPRAPSLCVSGINHGLNLGVDTFYSGTVAAAREAALRGVPSIAFSADVKANLAEAASICAKLVAALHALPRGHVSQRARLFNVNFPPGERWPEIRATSLGARFYAAEVEFRADQRGGEYLWIGGANPKHGEAPGSDTEAYDLGVVGVTELSLDQSFTRVDGARRLIEQVAISSKEVGLP